jgi:hypothetical protein
MDVDKEKVKQALNRLIDEGKWPEAQRLLDAIESRNRNESIIRKALDDTRNVLGEVRHCG